MSEFARGGYDLASLVKKDGQAQGAGAGSAAAAGQAAVAGQAAGAGQTGATASRASAGQNDGNILHSPFRIELTEANLREVLERSRHLPVIALFVTEGVGAELAVKLEDLAARNDGRFQLAVSDARANARVAQAFRVQGVPAAIAILQAQTIPLFQGVPDAAQLDSVVDEVLAAATQYGMAERVTGSGVDADGTPHVPAYELAARDAIADGNLDRAAEIYNEELAQNPGNDEAKAGLARVELQRRTAGGNAADAVRAADAAGPADVDLAIAASDAEVAAGLAPHAFARLIDTIAATSDDDRERARVHLLELFEAVGVADPAVTQARGKLASVLF